MSATNPIFIEAKGTLGSFVLNVAFHAPLRGVTALFGPSGCGKTSVLRVIAGLNKIEGTIKIGNDLWQGENVFLPTHKRPIGYVFQEASLFPHLSVRSNLVFGMAKSQSSASFGFDEVVAILGLEPLIARHPHHLSGGERQRVAIGRALLSSPQVLLMDEPLSALDQKMREDIMPFLLRLREHFHLPIFYISHDMREVERLADYLVLMQNGHVIAHGDLQQLQADLSLPLARGRDATVSLEARFEDWDIRSGLAKFVVPGGQFFYPLSVCPSYQRIRLQIAAGDVSLTLEKPKASSILNILPVQIISATKLEENEILVSLKLGKEDDHSIILSRLSYFSWRTLQLYEGMQIYAQIKAIALLPKH